MKDKLYCCVSDSDSPVDRQPLCHAKGEIRVSPVQPVICVWPFSKAGALGLTETSQSSRMFIDLQILEKHGSSELNYVSVVSSCYIFLLREIVQQ